IKIYRLFSFAIEPQERGDFLHVVSFQIFCFGVTFIFYVSPIKGRVDRRFRSSRKFAQGIIVVNSLYRRGAQWLPPERKESAQSFVAQVEPAPNQQADINWEQHVGKERTSHAHMRRHGAAEIAGQQYRAEKGRARNHIKDGAGEKNNSKTEN